MVKYRIPLFEKLRTSLMRQNIKLNVLYGTPSMKEVAKYDSGHLAWGVKSPCRYLNFNAHQIVFQSVPRNLLRQQDLVIVTHENSLVLNYWLLLKREFIQTRIAFWGHGTNFQSIRPNRLGQKIKSWTATKVDWWFAYTQLSVDKVAGYGFPESRITCLDNSIDMKQLIKWKSTITPSNLNMLKEHLKLKGKFVGVFVGSLYEQKRLHFLFEASEKVKQALPEFELILIGDGPMRNLVADFCKKNNWAVWAGAQHDREKALHLSLGHVMLNPGLVGLCILDSFAMGIPLVTTDCGIHSPEIAYLKSGENGLMTKNSTESFKKGVLSLFTDQKRYESLSAGCIADSKTYSLDKMAANFSGGICKALTLNLNKKSSKKGIV